MVWVFPLGLDAGGDGDRYPSDFSTIPGNTRRLAPVVGKLFRLVGTTEQQCPRGAVLQYVAEKVERCPASRSFHHFAQALKFIEAEEKALARKSAF